MRPLILFTALLFSAGLNAQNLDYLRELDEINDPALGDAYPYITDDGLRLYYTGNDGFSNNMFFTSRPDLTSDFGPRQLLDSSFFVGVLSSWFTIDELEVYYSNGSSLFHSSRLTTSSAFDPATEIELVGASTSFLGGPSLTPSGDELYIYTGDGLMEYEYTNDSTYTFVSEVTPPVGYTGSVAQLSKDGLDLFWAGSQMGTDYQHLFQVTRVAIGDDFLSPTLLNNQINSSVFVNSQPSYASSVDVLVWVRNGTLDWLDNDLFLAQSDPLSVDEFALEQDKELMKIVDLLGRETDFVPGVVLIYVYSDGSAERRMVMK